MPASLSSLVPLDPAPPAAVVEAREKAVDLQQRLLDERQAARAAAEQLLQSEKADREAMAHSFATGQTVSSDERGIEKARRARDTATRRAEAAGVAAQDAETRLRDEINRLATIGSRARTSRPRKPARRLGPRYGAQRCARASRTGRGRDRVAVRPRRLRPRAPGAHLAGERAGTEKWTANSDPLAWPTLLHELDASLAGSRPPSRFRRNRSNRSRQAFTSQASAKGARVLAPHPGAPGSSP